MKKNYFDDAMKIKVWRYEACNTKRREENLLMKSLGLRSRKALRKWIKKERRRIRGS